MAEFPHSWMWSEACDMLARAERMHREFFRLSRASSGRAAWEPPIDMIETEREVLILAALPGVDPDGVDAVIDGAVLVIAGSRLLPAELQFAVIHRLELPQGRFERRIPLPAGRYTAVRRSALHGCILITLEKAGGSHG